MAPSSHSYLKNLFLLIFATLMSYSTYSNFVPEWKNGALYQLWITYLSYQYSLLGNFFSVIR